MALSFRTQSARLRELSLQVQYSNELEVLLSRCSKSALPSNQHLLDYYNALICSYAYAAHDGIRQDVLRELQRIAVHTKTLFRHTRSLSKVRTIPENEGLPWQTTDTAFSPAFLRWLHSHEQLEVEAHFTDPKSSYLNDILALSLHNTLRSETTAGADNESLLKTLGVTSSRTLPFVLQQLSQLKALPTLEDSMLEKLGMHVRLRPLDASFSRAANRISFVQPYYHDSSDPKNRILRSFDHEDLIKRPLTPARKLNHDEQAELVLRIKNAMALTARETDPATFLDEDSLRFYEMERGVAVAVYGIQSERQLSLESYMGYTLFKNGLACAYGGAWVFGSHANFGINIHEAFRGGESGFIMCQLLRLYTQIFSLESIEVEPYQYGLDNPEGISTAAFWFYYRYGFRPIDKELFALAERERARMKKNPKHRSSERTLRAFTASNVVRGASTKTLRVADLSTKILRMIAKDFKNDDREAAKYAVATVCTIYPKAARNARLFATSFEELALCASAMKKMSLPIAQSITKLSQLKSRDQYAYQKELRVFLRELRSQSVVV